MKGRFPTGSMTLDLVWVSGLHLRPSPAANITAFKSIIAQDNSNRYVEDSLLYIFSVHGL
jgi:hypothetical protein